MLLVHSFYNSTFFLNSSFSLFNFSICYFNSVTSLDGAFSFLNPADKIIWSDS